MFYLFLFSLLIELLVFTTFTHFYSFWDVISVYLLPSLLGLILLAPTGRSLMTSLKGGAVPGQMPGNAVLHKGAQFIGAICLTVPTFLARVLALILLMPGLRHLAVKYFKSSLFNKIAKGSAFSFVRFGGPGAGGGPFGGGFGRGPGAGAGPFAETAFSEERDATVVDITPLEITHSPSKGEPPKDN